MIIFVGGLIGAGKSTIAKGLARHFSIPYYDVDETKKVVGSKDPDYEKNMREGIPLSDKLRYEVFEHVFDDIEQLLQEHLHVVVDEALHKREIRQALYDKARRVAGAFIVIWVQADEDIILQRLGSKKRVGHMLADPLPMHETLRDEFEHYNRCIIDCPNNGTPENAISDLVRLIESIGSLSRRAATGA